MNKAAEAFRTIGEVADDLDVPKHVLRFWEGKFPQIRPMKRGGGRRYYRPEDLELLRGIRHLLHAEGYTIKGVQKILREHGIEQVKTVVRESMNAAAAATGTKKRGRKPISPAAKSIGYAAASKTNSDGLKASAATPSKSEVEAKSEAKQANAKAKDLATILAALKELELCRAILSGQGQPLEDSGDAKRMRLARS